VSTPPTPRAAARVHRAVTFDMEALYVAIDRKRRAEHLSWREIGRAAGLHSSTAWMTRLARGHFLHLDTIAALLVWLGSTDLAPYLRTPEENT
jgi:hypothetical protein